MPRSQKLIVDEASEGFDAPELMFEELDGLLGYRLRRAQGAMHRDYMAAVAGLDLTQKQTATLWLIQSNPGSCTGLGGRRARHGPGDDDVDHRPARRTQSSDSQTIDRRIAAARSSTSRPGGQGLLRKVKARIAKHEERVKSLFKPAELEGLLAALKKFQALA